jgi:hypothetical protein
MSEDSALPFCLVVRTRRVTAEVRYICFAACVLWAGKHRARCGSFARLKVRNREQKMQERKCAEALTAC